MDVRPLIIPFQTEVYMANNKNTPDKNCVQIAPDYANVEYTSYLGGKIVPPPFTYQRPLEAGIHLHFILPGCFRRAEQKQVEESKEYRWEYASVPDRFIVTRMVPGEGGNISYKNFIVESNYLDLDNRSGVAIPFLSDARTSHRFLGRSFEYGKKMSGDGEYLENLTAMGAGDPYFSAYYPSCFSVFGFYDDMSDVPVQSDVSYFVTGYFSQEEKDPFYAVPPEQFWEKMTAMGLTAKDEGFHTNRCILFGEVWGIRWEGYSADYKSGRPTGEISCGMGNTSSEIISAVIGKAGKKQEEDWERLFNMLQYEVADTLDEVDGLILAEDEIHRQTFASGSGGTVWALQYEDKSTKDLPNQTGFLLAALNQAQREYNRKKEEIIFWQDAAYADWYSYMLLFEGEESSSEKKEKMKQEIFRICREVLPKLKAEAEALELETKEKLAKVREQLKDTGILVEQTGDEDFQEPKEPVLMLYGKGIERSYAFVDEGSLLCQTNMLQSLSDGKVTLQKGDLLGYIEDIPKIIPEFEDLFVQAVCLNDFFVEMIGKLRGLPKLSCDKSRASDLASKRFKQSWLTLLIEWKLNFHPSRTLLGEHDTSMTQWKFDGMDYENDNEAKKEIIQYSGRNVITPHSLYRFRYAAEKYISQAGEVTEEMKEVLEQVEKLPVLSQSLDGLNQQLLSRMKTLQVPVIGNESDEELTKSILENVFTEKSGVNQTTPFFPLRAGHIHLETVNIINSFGLVQNAFSNRMNPVYSQVMGNYEDTNNNTKFGKLRPRILQGARMRADFVTAQDEKILAEPTAETTPVCGMILPELLNGRLALYSAKGNYYGCIKTVYREGHRSAAWLSPPDRIEEPFEKITFDNLRFQKLAAYLLEDSKKGGTAFIDLLELIKEQHNSAVPAGTGIGEELPYIWGRPLAVSLCRVGLECRGRLAFSQLLKDYGTYHTLSAEKVEFPLMAGDKNRARSGIVGYYEDWDYTKIYPAYGFGTADTDGGDFSDYVKTGEQVCLCLEGKEKVLTILSEIGNVLYFQTGILPVVKKTLDGAFTDCVSQMKMCFEADSVLCAPSAPRLPVPASDEDKTWYFESVEQKNGEIRKQKVKITGYTDTFCEENEILCDGYLTMEKETE